MSCPRPPRPCECGCGALLRQPSRGGPRRFCSEKKANAACEAVARAEALEVEAVRDVVNFKRRERYRQERARRASVEWEANHDP